MGIEQLLGKTLTKVESIQHGDDEEDADEFLLVLMGEALHFHTDDGEEYAMGHYRDCSEVITLESIVGELNDLVGTPICWAEKVIKPHRIYEDRKTHTRTFYKLATAKGYVDIRWYGESNGYYSEEADFKKL